LPDPAYQPDILLPAYHPNQFITYNNCNLDTSTDSVITFDLGGSFYTVSYIVIIWGETSSSGTYTNIPAKQFRFSYYTNTPACCTWVVHNTYTYSVEMRYTVIDLSLSPKVMGQFRLEL
jgi:hypothetical protein